MSSVLAFEGQSEDGHALAFHDPQRLADFLK